MANPVIAGHHTQYVGNIPLLAKQYWVRNEAGVVTNVPEKSFPLPAPQG